jgi:UDP-N-acetylglucosamine-lysosomal-enzyme
MLVSNVSLAVAELDDVRRNPRKFLCLNDDMDEASPDTETVSALRADFFESLFPIRSSFELPDNYRNRFLRTDELREWRRWRQTVRVVTYACFSLLVVFTLASFFNVQVQWGPG